MKRAFVTGITGQDGSYLAELLLDKDYEVHGLVRRSSLLNRSRIDHLHDDERLHLHYGDLTDGVSLVNLVRKIEPHEVYNLGRDEPRQGVLRDAGLHRLDQRDRHPAAARGDPRRRLECRFYQASTSEMFGSTPPPQNEDSKFHPRSPYGSSKLQAHWVTMNYREAYGLFGVSGILFNHESPRRGENFVTRKITRAVAAIEAGLQDHVELGNLDAVRDWGYAPEYVEGMWRMLQADEPTDYVLATGVGHSVRDFCEAAFAHAGMDWRDHVKHNESFERPPRSTR